MLRQRAVASALWSGIDLVTRHGLSALLQVVLARLLTPAEFGTVALLAVFTGIASALVDSGFSTALIQRQDITHVDESTVFWCNLGIGAVAALGLGVGGPAIAHFYGAAVLGPLSAVFGIDIFVRSLGAIHSTLLTKRLDFSRQAKIGAAANILSGIVATVLAANGAGVWALAAQALVAGVSMTALLWALHPWRPAFVFDRQSARRLFGFGGYMLASSLVEVAFSRMYTVLIGKAYGARDLGLYARALATRDAPNRVFTGVLWRAALPIFSEAAGDVGRLRRGLHTALRASMLVSMPAVMGIAAISEPLIEVLFGARWLPASELLSVLCFAGALWPCHALNLNVLLALGHSHLLFRLEVVKSAIGIALLSIGASFGLLPMAWSQVAYSALALFLNGHYTATYLDYGSGKQLRAIAPVALASVTMYLAARALNAALDVGAVAKLLVVIPTAAALYAVLVTALDRRLVEEIRALLRGVELR